MTPKHADSPQAPLRILSLGAGVQSSVVLLMSIKAVLPKLDAAIFADTQWEPRSVYDHLAWLEGESKAAGIPVHRVTAGNLREHAIMGKKKATKEGKHFVSLPYHVVNPNGTIGHVRRRQCTRDYKVRPITRKIRELVGLRRGQKWPSGVAVQQWFGISADEANRVRIPQVRAIENFYPLVYELGMTRSDCIAWAALHYPGRVFPRSACIGCPYHNDEEWDKIKSDPEAWADAVDADKAIRISAWEHRGKSEKFLHADCQPLETVTLQPKAARPTGPRLFRHECMGMCGV